jgi:hypothetical protein
MNANVVRDLLPQLCSPHVSFRNSHFLLALQIWIFTLLVSYSTTFLIQEFFTTYHNSLKYETLHFFPSLPLAYINSYTSGIHTQILVYSFIPHHLPTITLVPLGFLIHILASSSIPNHTVLLTCCKNLAITHIQPYNCRILLQTSTFFFIT